MSEFEIDFEWPVAPKFVFRPATADDLREIAEDYDYSRVPEAERPLAFGEIIPIGESRNHRPKAAAIELAIRDLVEFKDILLLHTVALKVARVLGPIRRLSNIKGAKRPHGDKLFEWYMLARRLRLMFEGKYKPTWPTSEQYTWPHPVAQYQGDLGIFLVPDKDDRPVVALRPHDLEGALVLYAARMIAAGTTLNSCKNCEGPFLSGGIRERRKKRADATFCSDECRWKYHNEARRKARIGG
jgi:hypothetical protein